jgi:hypothetical protein
MEDATPPQNDNLNLNQLAMSIINRDTTAENNCPTKKRD